MAAIQNLQVAVFCNQQIRPACDKFIQLYYWCKVVQEMWTSQGLAALIPNASDLIADGSATDGRPMITDGNVNIIMSWINTYVTNMEANSNIQLNQIGLASVNQRTVS